MKITLSARLCSFLLSCAFLLNAFSSYATHIVGADMMYQWISGNTYRLTIVLYSDCGPYGASALSGLPISAPQVCIYNGDTYVSTASLHIRNPLCGMEVTPLICQTGQPTQCTDPNSITPGIMQFNYTDTITLPGNAHYWRFIYNGSGGDIPALLTCSGDTGFMNPPSSGRGASVTNIASPATSDVQLIDTLDNTYHHNSSPQLTALAAQYFCINNVDCYDPGGVDAYDPGAASPQGDSLVFSLVPATVGQNICGAIGGPATYIGIAWSHPDTQAITGATPLQVGNAGQFNFNTANGQICFLTNMLQRSEVVYNIRQYRNDTFIGSCQREMNFLVQTCTGSTISAAYTGATAGKVPDSTDFLVCPGLDSFSIYITPKDDDTITNITAKPVGLPSGATFATIDTNVLHPVFVVTWASDSVVPGTYSYWVKFADDHCPYPDSLLKEFYIKVSDPFAVTANVENDVCMSGNGSITAAANGGEAPYTYRWSNDSTGAKVTALTTGSYSVTAIDENGCKGGLSVTVGEDICPEIVIVVHDVITPDGDGINDVWVIEDIQKYKNSAVQVFDKWGDMLYEQHAYQNDWQGVGSKGEVLPSGTYYYLVKLNSPGLAERQNVYSGALLIKR